MYHVSKCGFTSCKTGSKNKKTKKNPKATLLKVLNFFSFKLLKCLAKGCVEYLKKKIAFLQNYKEENPTFRGPKLFREFAVLG